MAALRIGLWGIAVAIACTAPAIAKQAAPAARSPAPYVRPDVQAFLDRQKANPRPPMTREFILSTRTMAPGPMPSSDLPAGELGEIRDLAMPGPAGPIKLRLFDPRKQAERKPGPVVVFYHGGGFTLGSIDTHTGLAAEMARALDLPVVSVDYRLAPEHPFPAATDDGEAAARWIAANGAAFGRTFTGLVLSGDSAGGSLTLVAGLALRDKPAALPVVMQFPIYPVSDLRNENGANRSMYAAVGSDWRASPVILDLAGSPPTVLITASLDSLRDQGRAYSAKLIQAGVPTTYYEARGTIHGFATYRKAIPSAQQDVATMFALARTMLAQVLVDNKVSK